MQQTFEPRILLYKPQGESWKCRILFDSIDAWDFSPGACQLSRDGDFDNDEFMEQIEDRFECAKQIRFRSKSLRDDLDSVADWRDTPNYYELTRLASTAYELLTGHRVELTHGRRPSLV